MGRRGVHGPQESGGVIGLISGGVIGVGGVTVPRVAVVYRKGAVLLPKNRKLPAPAQAVAAQTGQKKNVALRVLGPDLVVGQRARTDVAKAGLGNLPGH